MVDVPPDAVSLSELARKRGVSKQAIHKRVAGLAAAGRLATFAGPGGAKLVSAAAFDFAVGETGDPVKEEAARTAAVLRGAEAPETDTPAYRDAKARDAYYVAELRRLEFERENGRLYTVEEVDAALVRIGDAVKAQAKLLVARADEGAEACEKGMPAFRRWLSRIGEDLCRSFAAELRVVAAGADAGPEPDCEALVSDHESSEA